jgi:hypothetical protein
MTWTREPPKVAGYYWLKFTYDAEPVMTHVKLTMRGWRAQFFDSSSIDLGQSYPGHWLGPITVPKGPE